MFGLIVALTALIISALLFWSLTKIYDRLSAKKQLRQGQDDFAATQMTTQFNLQAASKEPDEDLEGLADTSNAKSAKSSDERQGSIVEQRDEELHPRQQEVMKQELFQEVMRSSAEQSRSMLKKLMELESERNHLKEVLDAQRDSHESQAEQFRELAHLPPTDEAQESEMEEQLFLQLQAVNKKLKEQLYTLERENSYLVDALTQKREEELRQFGKPNKMSVIPSIKK